MLANCCKNNESYVERVLRLTLLAPDIVGAIPDGRQPAEMTLAVLMRPFAVAWTHATIEEIAAAVDRIDTDAVERGCDALVHGEFVNPRTNGSAPPRIRLRVLSCDSRRRIADPMV
jgi:hypothetical protein